MKSIEQIIQLSMNPHYRLSKEELQQLNEYQKKSMNAKNKNVVITHNTHVPKNDIDETEIVHIKE